MQMHHLPLEVNEVSTNEENQAQREAEPEEKEASNIEEEELLKEDEDRKRKEQQKKDQEKAAATGELVRYYDEDGNIDCARYPKWGKEIGVVVIPKECFKITPIKTVHAYKTH